MSLLDIANHLAVTGHPAWAREVERAAEESEWWTHREAALERRADDAGRKVAAYRRELAHLLGCSEQAIEDWVRMGLELGAYR